MSAIHVVIPAGGAGTRLWPLSRRNRPKFLLDLDGSGLSLLQQTLLRLEPVAATITIVTGQAHVLAVRQQIKQLVLEVSVRVLAEPAPKDSMAAIGFAAYLLRREFGDDAIVGSFAADHVIAERDTFLQTIQNAALAAKQGFLTTIGLTPDFASTAYGYIQTGRLLDFPAEIEVSTNNVAGNFGVFQVEKFVEKPSWTLAKDYVSQGFLWNAGMFIFQTKVLVELLQTFLPKMDEGLQIIADASGSPGFAEQVETVWPSLPKIAIDHALAEPAAAVGRVAVAVAPQIGWSDVGDFASLSQIAKSTKSSGSVIRVDSSGGYVTTSATNGGAKTTGSEADSSTTDTATDRVTGDVTGSYTNPAVSSVATNTSNGGSKTIAILGLDNVVVVDSEDVLLVTTTEHAQEVKKIVNELKAAGLDNLL